MEHNDHIQTPNNPLGDEIDRDDGLASMYIIWDVSQIKGIFFILVNFVSNSFATNESKTFSCKVPRAYSSMFTAFRDCEQSTFCD